MNLEGTTAFATINHVEVVVFVVVVKVKCKDLYCPGKEPGYFALLVTDTTYRIRFWKDSH